MRLVLLLLLGFALGACQCGRCDAVSCDGCCDSASQCQPGDRALACGERGSVCVACAGTDICHKAACAPRPPIFTGGPGGGGGTAGGGTAGGAVPPPPVGTITDVYGQSCSNEGPTSADCGTLNGLQLGCQPAVTSAGMRFVCQFWCQPNATCASGTGQCRPSVEPTRTCLDCVRSCFPATGWPNASCFPNELCVPRPGGGGGVCTPDCRTVGARCLGGAVCLPNGQCSGGALVSYCQAL
ncbi:MAG: hypothetical protein Q8N26_28855 [Myxococcales bacterium]|nr:hypothetical protein [Myxococcales bacterium]